MTEKNKGGRPSKYDPDTMPDKAFKLTLLGATDVQLADFFDVNVDTIYEWKKVYSKFSEAITKGKVEADSEVAHSFYQRAKGFEYEEKEERLVNDQMVTVKVIKKHMAPDTKAGVIWLSNRTRGKYYLQWVDSQRNEVTGKDGAPIETNNSNTNIALDFSQLTEEEINLAIKLGLLRQQQEEEE